MDNYRIKPMPNTVYNAYPAGYAPYTNTLCTSLKKLDVINMENKKEKKINSKTDRLKAIGNISVILGLIIVLLIKFNLIDDYIIYDIALILIIGGIIFTDPFYLLYRKLNRPKQNDN